jgi:peptide/nickel transport system substrate-binding protein
MMNKSGLTTILTVAFFILSFGYTNQVVAVEYGRQDTVIFDMDSGSVPFPKVWNPYIQDARFTQGFHQALIEPLFILNYETGKIMPWLAKEFSQNKTADVWHIKLREGIRWSDGQPMDADDVVFTVKMLKNTPDLVNTGRIKDWVGSVKKIDDFTIQFSLTRPNPRFLLNQLTVEIFNSLKILPEHIWKDKDVRKFTNYDPEKGWPIFTGPYKLASTSESRFVYIRDDNWWGSKVGFRPLPQPKQLIWVYYGPEETRASAMVNHDLDSLMDVKLETFTALKNRNPNAIIHHNKLPLSWSDPCPRSLELNNEAYPWNDKELRWALNYAIDRGEVVSRIFKGTTVAAHSIFPPYHNLKRLVGLAEKAGLFKKYPVHKFDPDKARKIIESKGYALNQTGEFYVKDGNVLSIHIEAPDPFIEKKLIAANIVEQLRRVSINATIGIVDYDSFFANYSEGAYEARLGWQSCGSVSEPWSSLNNFNIKFYKPIGQKVGFNQVSGDNGWRWRNEKYSSLIDEIGKLPVGDSRIDALFVEAMDIWMSELPIIPITQAKKLIPFDTAYWVNWPTANNSYIQPPTWWQSAHVIIHNLRHSKSGIEDRVRENISVAIKSVTSNAPPFNYEENGVQRGVSTDVVRKILDKVGIKSEIEVYPLARAQFIAKRQPNTLIYPIERLPDVENMFKWVGAITPVNTYVYKKKSRTDIQIDNIDGLRSYEIGVRLKGGSHQYLESRGILRLSPVVRLEQSLRMLEVDRVDVVVASEFSFSAEMKHLGFDANDYERVFRIDDLSTNGYLAFSQNTPESLVMQFREAFAKIQATGEFNKILLKYGYR